MEHIFLYKDGETEVQTTQGWVRGYRYDGISIFKGIPYAQARRFHKPEEKENWNGVLDATSYGYVCPLMNRTKPSGELYIPHRYWIENEDCLNLNIWTPMCDEKKRPVIVWIHGGGFSEGSSIEMEAYDGKNMCVHGDVVVVSLNHRLNILGYLDVSSLGKEYENSGNCGNDDIIAALKWIQKNIAKFGGNPENVTIMGQSGGGAKVAALLQTPEADGLYHKGIIMSGVISGLSIPKGQNGEKITGLLMKELGISSGSELEQIPYEKLVQAYKKVSKKPAKSGEYVGGMPYPNNCYKGDALSGGFRRETEEIPLLIGCVYGEFMAFLPKSPACEGSIQRISEILGEKSEMLIRQYKMAYPKRDLGDLLNLDYMFRKPTIKYIMERSKLNNCTYSYMFNLDFDIDGRHVPWHCCEIPYFFHNTEMVPAVWRKDVTENMEDTIFQALMSFVRTGKPESESLPHWDACTDNVENIMIFDEKCEVRKNFDHDLIPLAEEMLGEYIRMAMNRK